MVKLRKIEMIAILEDLADTMLYQWIFFIFFEF